MKRVPLDLWAYRIHLTLTRKPGVLAALDHADAADLPADLINPLAPADAELLAPYQPDLDASAAVVADWLRASGPRAPQLLSLYSGQGAGFLLVEPLVTPGPGLQDLVAVVEHLGARKLGDPLPPAPQVKGHTTNARPVQCRCGARIWSVTPVRLRDGMETGWVEDGGGWHACPAR